MTQKTAAYGASICLRLAVADDSTNAFTFEHRIPGCDFRLTIERMQPIARSFKLMLSGDLHDTEETRPFTSGSSLQMSADSSTDFQIERIVERVHLLSPTRLTEDCELMLKKHLKDWFNQAASSE